jgi:hypothetical protein
MIANEVKSHSLIDRFLIAFHSPLKNSETGLPLCRPEKMQAARPHRVWERFSLQCGLRLENGELAGFS